MKRFWREVTAGPEGIALDGRPVRTPGCAPLIAPTRALIEAIADEWRAVGDTVDPRAMPLTGLANAAIDRIAPNRAAFAAGLARYAESDLLCYRAEGPAELIARQTAAWDPPLAWASRRYDVHFEVTAGVIHRSQPPATLARLGEAMAARDAFVLAGLSPVVTVAGSLVLALALVEGSMEAGAVWQAARVDDDWQAEQWGEDELAIRATAAHRADFNAGARLLKLLSA